MNRGETIQNFLSRVSGIVNQIRGLGEEILEKTIVAKVLRSLLPKFDHVVAAIEESKDLSTYTFDELMGSLQVHEVRLNKSVESEEGYEKAFYMKGELSRGRSRDNQPMKGLECYYCHKFGHVQAKCYKKQRDENRGVECYYCHKFGHVEAECYKKKREKEQADFVEEKSNQASLFLAVTQPQLKKVEDSFEVTLDSTLKEQLEEREKYILGLELKLQEKEKELCALQIDNEAKARIIEEKNQELATMRREHDNSKIERDQHVQRIHGLQEQLGEKDRCIHSLEEQQRIAQHNLFVKEAQLMEVYTWLSRKEEMGTLQFITNQILQAELHARTEQFNQMLSNFQRQYVEMEKNHLEVIQKLQVDVNVYKEKADFSQSQLQNLVLHEGSKHVDIILQLIRGLVADQQVELKNVNIEKQVADILIKALGEDKLESMRKKLEAVDFGSRGSVGN